MDIKDNSLFQNRIQILKMAHKRMLAKLRKPVDKEEWVIFLDYLKPFVILLMDCSINSKSLSLAAATSNSLGWFNSVAALFSGEGILKQDKRFAIFNLRSNISIGHHFGTNRIWSQRCGASLIPLENCIWAITDTEPASGNRTWQMLFF